MATSKTDLKEWKALLAGRRYAILPNGEPLQFYTLDPGMVSLQERLSVCHIRLGEPQGEEHHCESSSLLDRRCSEISIGKMGLRIRHCRDHQR